LNRARSELKHLWPLALLVGATGLALVLALVLVKTRGLSADTEIPPAWRAVDRTSVAGTAVRAIVALGKPPVAIVTVALFAAAGARWEDARFSALALAAGSVVVISSALKAMPPATSFPSGHAAYSTAVFGTAAWMAVRVGAPRPVPVALCAVPVLMGPALVIKGAHWPLDIAGGYALGGAWFGALVLADLSLRRARRAERRDLLRVQIRRKSSLWS
jgi:membrane-associated phospholipid phosphatase